MRFAALTNDLRHFNGRTGMGAVMGSKNLKADRGARLAQVQRLGRTIRPPSPRFGRRLAEAGQRAARRAGTCSSGARRGWSPDLNAGGILPTRNFHEGAFEGVDNIKWEVYEKELLTARRSCYACAVRCKREVRSTTAIR